MSTSPQKRPPSPAPALLSRGGALKQRFLRNVLTLMTGTVVAQALSLAVTPVLTRLYTPDDFGVLGLLNAFSLLFVGIAALRFDMAIVVPKRDEDAANVLLLSLLAVFCTTAGTLLIVALGRGPIARLLGSPGLGDWLWLAPVIVLTSGLVNVLNFWCTRGKQFRRLSITSVLGAGAAAGAKVYAGGSPSGLITGQVLGQLVAALALAAQVLREDARAIVAAADRKRVAAMAREHADFAVYQVPLTLINGLSQNLPTYFLAIFFSPREVGYWALTIVLLSTPVFLVANAVRQVTFQRASEVHNAAGNLTGLLRRTTLTLALVGAGPAALLAIAAPWLFSAVLGPEWESAGHLARFAVVWQLTVLISAPATAIFPVLRLQRMTLVWQIGGVVVSSGALALGGLTGDVTTAVILYSITMALLNLLLIGLVGWGARGVAHRDAGENPE